MVSTSDTVVQFLCSTPMAMLSGLLRTNMAKPSYLYFAVTSFLIFVWSAIGGGCYGLRICPAVIVIEVSDGEKTYVQ